MEEIIKELKQLSESLYDEHQYTWSDQVDEIIEKLRAKTAEAVGHDLLVSGKFAERMDELSCWDSPENAHAEADEILCDLLKKLGYEDLVNKYEKIEKWYA